MNFSSGWIRTIVLSLFACVYVYPLYMLVAFSVKTNESMYANPFGWTGSLRWDNYIEAWTKSSFDTALLNSATITFTSAALVILVGAMAAYPLARRQERWATLLQGFFVAGLIVPMQLNLIPLFKLVHGLGLGKTHFGVICLYIAFGMPLTIFLFAGFIRSLPRELEEAARIDGSGNAGIFVRIVFPLLKPIATSVFILQFLTIWNDFFLPVVFLNTEKLKTVQIAVYSFVGHYSNDWSHMFPMIVLSVAPVLLLYIFLQKYIISGIMSGAVKG